MSTPKKKTATKKSTPAKKEAAVVKNETTAVPSLTKVKLADGSVVDAAKEKCLALRHKEDGTYERATPEDMSRDSLAYINVINTETKEQITYQVAVKKCDNGNFLVHLNCSPSLVTKVVEPKDKEVVGKPAKITLVGSGDAIHASTALVHCMKAWLTPFGLQESYRLVRMELKKGFCWQGLFVPAMSVV